MKFDKFKDLSFALYDPLKKSQRCQHFSFLVYKGKIITIGLNSSKTSPVNLRNPKICARTGLDISGEKGTCSELHCLLQFKNQTSIPAKKCVLVNVRINKNQEISLSRPCSSCQALLRFWGLKAVYYSVDEFTFCKF